MGCRKNSIQKLTTYCGAIACLIIFSSTVSAQTVCKWKEIAANTVVYGKGLIEAKPTISRTEFKNLMSKRLTADKTYHSTCTARVHRMPATIVGSCEMRDEAFAPGLRADFLDPRSWYWQWVMR
jgi:hypothetical protein